MLMRGVGCLLVVSLSACATVEPVASAPPEARAAGTERALELILTRAPTNPFHAAEVGDWWAYRVTQLDADGERAEVEQNAFIMRVTARHGEDVVVEVESDLPGQCPTLWSGWAQRVFDRQEPPALVSLGTPLVGRFSRFALSDGVETRTVAGEARACHRVSIAGVVEDDLIQVPTVVSFWFCPDLRGALVCLTMRAAGLDDLKLRFDLIGTGTATDVRWGECPKLAPAVAD